MKTIGTEDLKKIQLEIARHIDLFCKKHGIRYFICGGTLIGAIRHKGFIPWDDDIDIIISVSSVNMRQKTSLSITSSTTALMINILIRMPR